MIKKQTRYHRILNSLSIPIGLLGACFVAYGLFAPWLGFYLDDWYIIWFYKMFGARNFLEFFNNDRPLFAYVYMIFVPIFKDSRVAWQLFAILTHWLAVCSFFYLLQILIPKQKTLTLAASIIFAVYPGFQAQWFSVMYSQVFFLLAIYFLSYTTMIRAIEKDHHKVLLLIAAIICQLIGIAPMEYFYGYELVRPIILFIVLIPLYPNIRLRLKQVIRHWIPYLLVFIGFTIFRIAFSQSFSYKINLLNDLKHDPFTTLLNLSGNIFWTLYDSTFQVWVNLPQIFKRDLFTSASILMVSVIIIGFILTYFLLRRVNDNTTNGVVNELGKNLIWIGLFSILVSMVPFTFAGFEISLAFPYNRFLLAMSPGIAIFLVGIIEYLVKVDKQKVVIISILVSLSIGSQFLVARSFMLYWNQQKDFLAELTWRAPGLKENTILITDDLNFSQYFSGTSLTAPLNLIYASSNKSHKIPYLMFLATGGQASAIPTYEPDLPIEYTYRTFEFQGSTSSLIAFVKPSDGCLRILSKYDTAEEFKDQLFDSKRYLFWKEILPLSNLNRVIANPETPVLLPEKYFGGPNTEQWCYFYEKADLARQLMKWPDVISLYNQAEGKGFMPNNDLEWIPLIEAYVHTGKQEKAINLTRQLSIREVLTKAVICNTWLNLQIQVNLPEGKNQIENFITELKCQVAK